MVRLFSSLLDFSFDKFITRYRNKKTKTIIAVLSVSLTISGFFYGMNFKLTMIRSRYVIGTRMIT